MSAPRPTITGYDLADELGRGGMGVVYRATHQATGESRALKLLLRGAGATYPEVARFWTEACALACLKHPNILRIRDVGIWSGCPYLVTDFAAGGSLAGRTDRPHPPRWAARLIHVVADAVAHAHGRGLLHRDLKPSNVLLTADARPLVADFGLVKFTAPGRPDQHPMATMTVNVLTGFLEQMSDQFNHLYRPPPAGADERAVMTDVWDQFRTRTGWSPGAEAEAAATDQLTRAWREQPPDRIDLTATGSALGTPAYMAPEQVAGDLRRVGPPTDVYALGGVLFELLTGRRPFTGTTASLMMAKLGAKSPPDPADVARGVPDSLNAVCRRCLATNPEDRFADAAGVRDALGDCLRELTDTIPPAVPVEPPDIAAPAPQPTPGELTTAPRSSPTSAPAGRAGRWWNRWFGRS